MAGFLRFSRINDGKHSQFADCVLFQLNIQYALKKRKNGFICHLQPWHTLTGISGNMARLETGLVFL